MINQDKIKDFVDTVEDAYRRYLSHEGKSTGENGRLCGYQEVICLPEFIALKALVEDSNDDGCNCKTVKPGGVIEANRRGMEWYCANCGEEIVKDKPTGHNLSPVEPTCAKNAQVHKEDRYHYGYKDGIEVGRKQMEAEMTHTRAIDPTNGSPVIQSANNAQCNKEDTQEEPKKCILCADLEFKNCVCAICGKDWKGRTSEKKQTLMEHVKSRHSNYHNIKVSELLRLTSHYLEKIDDR